MIRIDIDMPECCADCPFIVQIPTMPGARKIFLCRNGWKPLKADYIQYFRDESCSMIEVDEEEQ